MNRENRYTLLLLAGGKSKRMGENKAELLYNGKTFVDNLIEKAKQLGIKQIYLSGYQQEQEGLKVVKDVYQGVGPIGGIHAGMKILETPYFHGIQSAFPKNLAEMILIHCGKCF